jgi:hypothetical protein
MFDSSFISIFLLIFLILCFVVFLWLRKKDSSTKPNLSSSIPNKKEGFEIVSSAYSGTYYGGIAGSYRPVLSQWNGSRNNSQLDANDLNYGDWPKTQYDKYYDIYENNEMLAAANSVAKLKDLTQPKGGVPSYGSTLGAFDSDTTSIPWDDDNKTSNQSDIVWGIVSEQASRSIFLKKWLQAVIADAEKMEPCGEGAANYCYTAPLLRVTVNDPVAGLELQQAEILIQAVGQTVEMSLVTKV